MPHDLTTFHQCSTLLSVCMHPIMSQNMDMPRFFFQHSYQYHMHLIFQKHILKIHRNRCQYELAICRAIVKPTQNGLLQLKQVLLTSIQIQALLKLCLYHFILSVTLYYANSHYFWIYSLQKVRSISV